MYNLDEKFLLLTPISFVSVPPENPQILDRWGRQLNGTVGPHEEGDDILLKCRTIGGHPEPKVRWLVNGEIVDEEYEQNSGDIIENRLTFLAVARRDENTIFTCQAINTNLIEPKVARVVLDLICEYEFLSYMVNRIQL